MTSYTRGAAIFCQNKQFQRFLSVKSGRPVVGPEDAAKEVRSLCGVLSRRELNTNPAARSSWEGLVREFNQWAEAGNGRI